jgi:hypothetical protein
VLVAHTCNLFGKLIWEGLRFQDSSNKKSLRDPISREKSWAWQCTPVIPVKAESIKYQGPSWLGQKAAPYLQNNQSKKDYRHGTNGRLPT